MDCHDSFMAVVVKHGYAMIVNRNVKDANITRSPSVEEKAYSATV